MPHHKNPICKEPPCKTRKNTKTPNSKVEPWEINLLACKASGPRAGWFLSIVPQDWLLKRLRLVD